MKPAKIDGTRVDLWQYRGRPALVAHRGDAVSFAENTMPALAGAYEAGARYVEFDVQLAADEVPILLHDDDLKRTSSRSGSVFEFGSDELDKVSVGEPERFGTRFEDVTVPTLATALEWLGTRSDCTAFVEVKSASIDHFGLATVANRVFDALENLAEQVVAISFDTEFVAAARKAGFTIGWALRNYDPPTRKTAEQLSPDYLFINHYKLTEQHEILWPGSWNWVLYEAATPELALHFRRLGAALAESMAASELLAAPPFAMGPAAMEQAAEQAALEEPVDDGAD